MQALIPVFAILAVAAGARLTLLPRAYLSDPLPVYHQSQDTRTGVHAYSYAGGPSAKEEVRGLDGVTRGSYSYVDAHGILQSVFYVADEGGFRVAATNLPTDNDLQLENSEILLARNAQAQNFAKYLRTVVPKISKAEEFTTSRRKRSLEAPINQDRRQAENPSSQADQADGAANASPKNSHELPAQEKKAEGRAILVPPAYGLLDAVLIPRLSGAATSHQSRVDVHNNVRLKAAQPVETIGVLSEPAYKILPSQVPLATSHQSRVQVHNNLRIEVPEKHENVETVEILQPQTAAVELQSVPLNAALSDYHEKRIQLHKSIGLEGANPKNTIKIDAPQVPLETPITEVHTIPVLAKETLPVPANDALPVLAKEPLPILTEETIVAKDALPVVVKEPLPVLAREPLPVLTKETGPLVVQGVIVSREVLLPVVTAASSQSKTQIHHNTKLEPLIYPIVTEPIMYSVMAPTKQMVQSQPILTAPIAQFFQNCSQIYSSEKLYR